MQSNHGFMAGFSKVSELITRFAGANVLWFICNLPIVFLCLSLLAMENANEMFTILITIMFLVPFIFFPSTAAMFGVVRKFILEEKISVIRSFLKYYKENYFKSMVGGIFITVLSMILAYYYMMLANISPLFIFIFVVLALVLFIFMLNFLSIIVHLNTKLFAAFKSAFLITISAPFLSIGVCVASIVLIYISINVITFLIPFFVGSIIAYIAFLGFYKVMLRLQELA